MSKIYFSEIVWAGVHLLSVEHMAAFPRKYPVKNAFHDVFDIIREAFSAPDCRLRAQPPPVRDSGKRWRRHCERRAENLSSGTGRYEDAIEKLWKFETFYF